VITATSTLRLNLGSGRYARPGWTNVDIRCPADIQADFRDLDFAGVETVRLSHLLEHISWRATVDVLAQLHGWLRGGGTVEVEVPDMDAILALGTQHPLWFKYVYGDQSHSGEYHLAGVTAGSLAVALKAAGFTRVRVRQFCSTHPGRDGMPCLEAVACA
jgi:hypothetical protein